LRSIPQMCLPILDSPKPSRNLRNRDQPVLLEKFGAKHGTRPNSNPNVSEPGLR
jgi:hypothetical protein